MTQVLAIDQGTTSSRAIVFGGDLKPKASSQQEFTQFFPASGWVEHDPEEIWASVEMTCRKAMAQGGDVAAIGITNQRETVVLWDRDTGKPVHNAVVWQDRRTFTIPGRRHAGFASPLIMFVKGHTAAILNAVQECWCDFFPAIDEGRIRFCHPPWTGFA